MVYITGDTHGDLERLKAREAKKLKRGDTLIVCGDFGFIWGGGTQERRALKWIGSRRYVTAFVDGVHENHDLLATYPVEQWNGGQIRRISGNLVQLMRGEVYEIEGKKYFAMGGGERDGEELTELLEGENWWPQEMPSAAELEVARQNLQRHGNCVDYIITHEPSGRLLSFITMEEQRASPLRAFLDELERGCEFSHWYFGSRHIDKKVPPRHRAVFSAVLPVEGTAPGDK